MTREYKPAAPSRAHSVASLAIGALLTVGLAGCGNTNLLSFGSDNSANLAPNTKPTIAIAAAQGVPQKYAAKVNEQLTASLREKGIQIVEAKDATYTIKPSYVAEAEAKKGTKVAYTIDVTDKTGNTVRRIAGDELASTKRGGDAWGHVNDEAVQKVVVKSATELTAWIDNPNAPVAVADNSVNAAASASSAPAKPQPPAKPKVAAAKPNASGGSMAAAVAEGAAKPAAAAKVELAAVVPLVNGAPGDGKTALADAMKRALASQGVKVASAAGAGTYKVQGQVEIGTPSNGVQPIKIIWVVTDPSGKQMEKTVVQNNKVEEGRLEKNWGEIADQAAGAAAIEVSKLLSKMPAGQAQQAPNRSAG